MNHSIGPDELFERMCVWDDNNYIMNCATKAGSDSEDTDGDEINQGDWVCGGRDGEEDSDASEGKVAAVRQRRWRCNTHPSKLRWRRTTCHWRRETGHERGSTNKSPTL